MTKRPQRSILATFGSFSEIKNPEGVVVEKVAAPAKPQVGKSAARVGAGVIGATQRSISNLIEQRDQLQAIVESGGAIELAPDIIEPSPFPDRLVDESNAEFEEFKRSFAENGQQVPIQVRQHPERSGHYQIIYGHRRWRAAKELDLPLKAIIIDLDDRELVVAQGIENGARQDLSWIERALFASTMDQCGIKARDIRAALSIDDAELAKMRSVCRLIPKDVIETIGRAPKIGRPRWLKLAALIGDGSIEITDLRETLSADKVLKMPSSQRFQVVLTALKGERKAKVETIKLSRPDGSFFIDAVFEKNAVRVMLPKRDASEFAAFLEVELPMLVEKYLSTNRNS